MGGGLDSEFIAKIIDIINTKAPAISEEKLKEILGKCQFEKDEARTSRDTFSVVYSTLLQKINNITLTNERIEGEQKVQIESSLIQKDSIELIKKLTNAFFNEGKCELSYAQIRQIAKLDKTYNFKNIKTETEMLFQNKNLALILRELKLNNVDNIFQERDKIDNIILHLFTINDYVSLDEKLQIYFPSENQRNRIIERCKVKDTSHLSLKAIKNIEPYLKNGDKYVNACLKAGYDVEQITKKSLKLLLIRDAMKEGLVGVNNPRVRKINNQVIKLINDLIKHKMYFDRIHIGLSKDVPQTKKEEKQTEESKQKVEELKKDARKIVGQNATENEIKKARLFIEQHEICPYCGKNLDRSKIKGRHYDIDHIKPFSQCFDNTFSNKVLVHAECNRDKSNRLPLDWLQGEAAKEYKNRINTVFKTLSRSKIKNLLCEKIEDVENPRIFTEKCYAAKFLKNYIEKYLDFESFSPESNLPKSSNSTHFQRVQTRNSSITSTLRNFWHIGTRAKNEEYDIIERYQKNSNFHTHRTEDAIILAFATQAIIEKIKAQTSKITSTQNEVINQETKRIYLESAPLTNMSNWLNIITNNIFPSRMVTRLNKYGKIHQDTICSIRNKARNYQKIGKDELQMMIKNKNTKNIVIIKNQSLNDKNPHIAKKNLENMLQKDSRNKKMYAHIEAYLSHGAKNKCIYKGVEIKSFKYEAPFKSDSIFVRHGVADKASKQKYLIYKKGGYFYVGVAYHGDNFKDDKTAIVKIIDADKYGDDSSDGYAYHATLYKNDLVYCRQKNKFNQSGYVEKIYYVDTFNTTSAQMSFFDPLIISQEKTESGEPKPYSPKTKFGKIDTNNVIHIERLEVDMLGNVYRFVNNKKTNFTREAIRIAQSQKAIQKTR